MVHEEGMKLAAVASTCGDLQSSTSWRSATNSSSPLPLSFIFVFIKIAGSDLFSEFFCCESLRSAIFLFTSFQNSHEIQLYRFTSSCKTTRRVVCQLVPHKTNNDVSSLFGSCQNRRYLFALFRGNEAGAKRHTRAPSIMGSMSNSQIKLCVAYNSQQRDTI